MRFENEKIWSMEPAMVGATAGPSLTTRPEKARWRGPALPEVLLRASALLLLGVLLALVGDVFGFADAG